MTTKATGCCQSALAKLTGLSFPAGTADFLSTHLDDGSQLDLTFTIPTAARAAFVTGSGLPALEDGRRVVTHSSPLWKLNPEGKIAGATDRHGTVVRATLLAGPGFGLNEAALEAMVKFTFYPAKRDGEPVPSTMIYNYVFLLDD